MKLKILSYMMIFLMLCSMMVSPIAQATKTESRSTSPTAFLPDWDITLNQNINPLQSQSYVYLEDTFGYDDQGNFYLAFVEDYAQNVHPDANPSTRGVHILKFDANGTHEWSKTVTSNSRCTSYNDYYCKLHGLFITGEDSFYVTLGTYYSNNFNFGSITKNVNSYTLITAYHDSNGWVYADSQSITSYAQNLIQSQSLNEAGDFILTLRTGTSGGTSTFDIAAFSNTGGKWVREYETPGTLMIDIENNETHILSTTQGYVKYDSQTINCPTGSQDNYCYIWISIDSNGVKNHTSATKYSSVAIGKFSVHDNQAYVFADTYDVVRNNHGQSNFSSTIVDLGTQSVYFASLNTLGTWEFTERVAEWPGIDDEYLEILVSDRFFEIQHPQGKIIAKITGDDVFYGNHVFDLSSQNFWKMTYFETDNAGTYQSNTTIEFDDLDNIPTGSIWSEDGYAAQLVGSDTTVDLPNGTSTTTGIAIISYETSEVVDYEVANSEVMYPIGANPEGHLMTYTSNSRFLLYAVDEDADNIGSGDNCPDVYNPTQSDYDLDLEGDACDSDDDNDGVQDFSDLCPLGLKAWISDSLNDHDSDGCKDSDEEDLDDDNDGIADEQDSCPKGLTGATSDTDADGCKDSEDSDDDDDGVNDGSDMCSPGILDWISGTITDHDGDGCRDLDEDLDDDNDGVMDIGDSCPKGEKDWPANINTDFDNDGCRDGVEDEDDDNDLISNVNDECPKSTGTVDSKGCSAEQNIDSGNDDGNSNSGNGNSNSGETFIYYVCQQGSIVVTDLADCPSLANDTGSTNETVTEFYFVCPGGSEVVNDMAECPDELPSTSVNTTIIIDPDSNNSEDYTVCENSNFIVMKGTECPTDDASNAGSNSISSGDDAKDSTDNLILIFAGGAFLMATAAVLIVLIRRPATSEYNGTYDSTEQMFKQQPELPKTQTNSPPNNMIGNTRDGYEWIEWPKNSGQHWYRDDGSFADWTAYVK
tara:strand:- start:93 stop:3044 length:2952 start_codon:yes stop_codon:yes gene_type:complete